MAPWSQLSDAHATRNACYARRPEEVRQHQWLEARPREAGEECGPPEVEDGEGDLGRSGRHRPWEMCARPGHPPPPAPLFNQAVDFCYRFFSRPDNRLTRESER